MTYNAGYPYNRHHTVLSQLSSVVDGIVVSTALVGAPLDQLKQVCLAFQQAEKVDPSPSFWKKYREEYWRHCCALWNKAVEFSNLTKGSVTQSCAQLYQNTSDLVQLLPNEDLSDEEQHCKLAFYCKTGQAWLQLGAFEAAEGALAKAMEYSPLVERSLRDPVGAASMREEQFMMLFDLYLTRLRTSWRLNQEVLSAQLLTMTKALVTSDLASPPTCSHLCLQLVGALQGEAQQQITSAGAEMEAGTKVSAIVLLLEAGYELIVQVKSKKIEESGHLPPGASQMEAKVLVWLAYCQNIQGDFRNCLNCIEALRQLDTPHGTQPTATLLALKAYVGAQQYDEAEVELLSLASNGDAPSEVCLEAVYEMMGVSMKFDSVLLAMHEIQQRHLDQPLLVVTFLERILNQEEVLTWPREQALLSLLDQSGLLSDQHQQNQELRERCYVLLWNHGVKHFKNKDFRPCVHFMAAALMFAGIREQAKVCRTLALCHIGLEDMDKALEYVNLSETYHERQVANALIRFKIHLNKKDIDGAVAEIQNLTTCEDFEAEQLQVLCQEALSCRSFATARAALQMLHQLLVGNPNSSTGSMDGGTPISEGTLLRVWIKCVLDEMDSLERAPDKEGDERVDDRAKSGAPPATAPVLALIKEVGHLFSTTVKRLQALGSTSFFGTQEIQKMSKQLDWFMASCWNCGMDAASLEAFQDTAVLMAAFGSLVDHHPEVQVRHLQQQKQAYLVAASAALEVHRALPDHPASLVLARSMLTQTDTVNLKLDEAARKLGPEAVQLHQDDPCDVFILLQEFELAVRLKDQSWQLKVLEKCRVCSGITPYHLCQLCAPRSQTTGLQQEVAEAVLKLALTKQLSQNGQPQGVDFNMVGRTFRELLKVTTTDESRLKYYREALQVLAGAVTHQYPPQEVQWLASTCWNRGLHQARFGRYVLAEQYMVVAMDLARYSPALAQQEDMMTDQLGKLRVSIRTTHHLTGIMV